MNPFLNFRILCGNSSFTSLYHYDRQKELFIFFNKKHMGRDISFDNLKTCLSFVVVVLHASLPFMPWWYWPLLPSDSHDIIPNIWMFVGFVHAFVMSMFFFISGYYVPQSYEKHGFGSFVNKKIIRLGIPLITMTLIQSVLLKKFIIGHLWYIQTLFVLSLLYAFYRKYIMQNGLGLKIKPSVISFITMYLSLAMASIITRRYYVIGDFSYVFRFFFAEVAHYPHYLLLFLLGIITYRNNWLSTISTKFASIFLVLGVMSMLLIFAAKRDAFMEYFLSQTYSIVESFFCLSFCLSIAVLFKKFCNWENSYWKGFAKLSYGIYIFHMYFLLIFQYFTHPLHVCVYIKYVGAIVVTTLVTSIFVWSLKKSRFIRGVI